MTESNLTHIMQQERERLIALRHDAENRKAAIDKEIAAIDQELKAIEAYETAKHGKKTRPGIRNQILAYIKERPQSTSRSDLLIAMNAKGDKAKERSITNALAALKKTGRITGEDGSYTAL